MSDREQVEELLSSIPAEHPLRVVVHAAGVLDDGLVSSLTPESVDSVLAAKADGAWHLHKLTEHMDLDAFVLFSSIAATLGSPGQGNYAAANAFLDALALHRHSNALQSISMGWGQWELETGITKHLGETDLARMARAGILALSNEQGLQLFDAAYATGEATVIPAGLDRRIMRTQVRTSELPALLRGMVPTLPRSAAREASSFKRRLVGLSENEVKNALLELVHSQTALVLGHASSRTVGVGQTFKDLGLDSLAGVELRNALNSATGLQLAATLIFDYPTPDELASHLVGYLTQGNTDTQPVEAELAGLERALSSISVDDDERAEIGKRLRSLMSWWVDQGEDSDLDGSDDELESATDDEIFQVLDSELGVS